MEYCFNVGIENTISVSHFNFTFLNHMNYKYNVIYQMLNGYDEFKLKNIYNNLYKRIIKLNNLYGIDLLTKEKINKHISYEDFDVLMNNYIDNDIIKSIIIINSIQQYCFPLINI